MVLLCLSCSHTQTPTPTSTQTPNQTPTPTPTPTPTQTQTPTPSYWCFNLFNDDAISTYISSCPAVIQIFCCLVLYTICKCLHRLSAVLWTRTVHSQPYYSLVFSLLLSCVINYVSWWDVLCTTILRYSILEEVYIVNKVKTFCSWKTLFLSCVDLVALTASSDISDPEVLELVYLKA